MFNWPNTDLLIVVQYTNRTQDKIETIQYTILYEYNTYSTTQSNTTIPYQIYSDIIKFWHLFFSRSWSSSNLAAGNLWGGHWGHFCDAKKGESPGLHLSATLQAKKAKRVMTSGFAAQVGCDWRVRA